MNHRIQQGFAIVESVLMIVILGVGLVSVAKLHGVLTSDSVEAKQKSEATLLAEAKIESLKHYTSLTTGGSAFDNISSGSDSVQGASTSYNRAWTITTNSSPSYKTANVTVSWTTKTNQSKSITLTSTLSRIDPAYSGDLITLSSKAPSIQLPSSGGQTTTTTDTSTQTSNETVVTISGQQVTLDSNNNVTKINGVTAVNVSGTITLANGGNAPASSVTLASINLVPSNTSNAYCQYSAGSYTCYMANTWSGTFSFTGAGTSKVCANGSTSYSNVTSNLTSKNYQLKNSSSSCNGSYSTQVN